MAALWVCLVGLLCALATQATQVTRTSSAPIAHGSISLRRGIDQPADESDANSDATSFAQMTNYRNVCKSLALAP